MAIPPTKYVLLVPLIILVQISFYFPKKTKSVGNTVEHGITGESSLKKIEKQTSQDQATFTNLITQNLHQISISF